MKKLIQTIKSIKLRQVLTVFLVGSLFIISTACSNGNVPQAEAKLDSNTTTKAMSDTYDQYDSNQPFKGGMNRYNDDPRYDTKAGADRKGLVDRAKSRQTDNVGEYFSNIGDRAGDNLEKAKRELPRALEDRKEDTAQDLQRRTSTLKQNLKNAPNEARNVFEGAKDTAKNALDDATGAAQRNKNEIQGNVEDLS
jgi:ElaB/YqjD/DUF883 family membrane-anchored ribosome-binding protein